MLIPKPHPEYWRLLTNRNITLRRAMPWTGPFQRQLWHARPRPFDGGQLLVASDYGGEHSSATHRIYAFMITQGVSPGWMGAIQKIRDTLLVDGRRMSFKRVVDARRLEALEEYLNAADLLDGHLVVVAVDKRIRRLVTEAGELGQLRAAFDLKARWNELSFEDMARKALFLTVCLSIWAAPGMDLTWVSDQDQSLANDQRLDDIQRFTARMTSLYLQFPMGVFAMNSTAIDGPRRHLEDLCAIPDLAAGMVSDVSSGIRSAGGSIQHSGARIEALSDKSAMIASWFWWRGPGLPRTMLTFDQVEGNRLSLHTMEMGAMGTDGG